MNSETMKSEPMSKASQGSCTCGQSVPLVHGDHHSLVCPMYASHDGIESHVSIEDATVVSIKSWIKSLPLSQYDMETLLEGLSQGRWRK